MYYDEHNPPHFHVYYGDDNAIISINTLELLEGKLPKRAMSMVVEWAIEHRSELLMNWENAEKHNPLNSIEPLK